MSNDMRITASNAMLRGLDTMLHKEGAADALSEGSSFANILSGVIGQANETDATAHSSIGSMMTGDYDPDVVMVSSVKAELALNLVLQVRDKALEAYNDIMRMQV